MSTNDQSELERQVTAWYAEWFGENWYLDAGHSVTRRSLIDFIAARDAARKAELLAAVGPNPVSRALHTREGDEGDCRSRFIPQCSR